VQPGLSLALLVIRRAVGELHQALIGNADPLAAVVTGVAGLHGNPRILHPLPHLDLGLAGALDAVDQHVALLFFVNGRVSAFVIALVTVGNVAGGAAHAAVVTALFTPPDAHVAALALLALIGKARQLGIGLDFFHRGQGDLVELGRQLVRVLLDQLDHIGLVGIGADGRRESVRVRDGVVSPRNLIVPDLLDAPGMQVALNLTGLGAHQGALQPIGIASVTAGLAAGVVGDPDTARVRVEGLGTRRRYLLGHASMRLLGRQALRVAAMTDDAALQIPLGSTQGPDGGQHGAGLLADRLDALVATHTALLRGGFRCDLIQNGGRKGACYSEGQKQCNRNRPSHSFPLGSDGRGTSLVTKKHRP